MNDEIAQLRLQLDRLSDEFRASQLTIRKLEKRRISLPNVVVLIGLIVATVLTINLWSAKAYSGSDPQAGGIAPSNPPTIFKAPFEIDDSAGKPIFIVTAGESNRPRGTYVFNDQGVLAVGAFSRNGGGTVNVQDTQNQTTVGMVADGDRLELGIKNHGKYSTVLKPGEVSIFGLETDDKPVGRMIAATDGGTLFVGDNSGRGSAILQGTGTGGELTVMKPDDPTSSSIVAASSRMGLGFKVINSQSPKVFVGADVTGNPIIYVYGGTGKPSVGLQAPNGKGQIAVFNESGIPIGTIAQGENGGKLELSNMAGAMMVEAGTLPEGIGIVRTGPASRMSVPGIFGVPGSYISGKSN